jgi:hypothetical protein
MIRENRFYFSLAVAGQDKSVFTKEKSKKKNENIPW